MKFNDIYNQFTKSTKENFPVDSCVIQNENETNVYDSDTPYLCLLIDKRFNNCWHLLVLYPYICKESETKTTFGWTDNNMNYSNIENSVRLWNAFVVGFREYKEDESYKHLWEEFIGKIEEQYED